MTFCVTSDQEIGIQADSGANGDEPKGWSGKGVMEHWGWFYRRGEGKEEGWKEKSWQRAQ